MSTPPASARISAFLPVMSQPTNQGPRIRFESGVGSLDATREDIFEVEVSCFLTNPSLTPHLDDFALVSGSLRCDSTGDRVIGHIDVSNLNIIVPAPDADSVDPTHPSTATLDLIGRVTAVNGRSFTLETGAYSHETHSTRRWMAICHIPDTKRWERTNPPAEGSFTSIRARWLYNDPPHVHVELEDITFLPRVPSSTVQSSSSTPSPAKKKLFSGKRKRVTDADADVEGSSLQHKSRRFKGEEGESEEPAKEQGIGDVVDEEERDTPPSKVKKTRGGATKGKEKEKEQ